MKGSQNLPTKLKEYRKKNHYSQEQVAEHMNLSRQAISNWETGKAYPDLDNLVMLSELYGTPVDELLNDGDMIRNTNSMSSINNNIIMEMIGLAIILVLSVDFSFVSIPISVLIIVWLRQTKRQYKIIYAACVVCILIGIYELLMFYVHISSFSGEVSIIPIG